MALWGNEDTADAKPKFATGNNVTGFTVAETQADKGVANPGWVLTTTGTGGRAGRKHHETLVAMRSMKDDPDADED